MTPHLRDDVAEPVSARIGAIQSVTDLGGMSGRTVVLVRGPDGALVVKGPVGAGEAAVPGTLARALSAGGVRTAQTMVVPARDGEIWLLIEYLPHELPRERWGADPAVLDALRAVHALPTAPVEQIRERYRPVWDDRLTAAAMDALEAPAELARSVRESARRSEYLFEPRAVVSADPNPMNWRIDATGAPVLIDWERITVAHPAIDLGILMPGLGDADAARAIAGAYGGPVDEVDVLRAKAWSIVELAATAEPGTEAAALVSRIREPVLEWLSAHAR